MKVLWLTNIAMPAMVSADAGVHTGSGGWMLSLLDNLSKRSDMKLAVACAYPGLNNNKIERDGVIYFTVSQGPARRLFHITDPDDDQVYMEECSSIIREWQPDVVHIHGTERFYGLLASHRGINVPIVISIQGLITEYYKWQNTFGNLSLSEILMMHHPLRVFRGLGPLWYYRRFLKNAGRERVIIQTNRYFIGRTDWDRAHVKALNPSAQYYHVDELLRPEFEKVTWDLSSCRRNSIIFTNARETRRGVDSLFYAVRSLKKQFPDISLRLAGIDGFTGEYGSHLQRVAAREGISQHVEFLGSLNAEQMSQALASSHVFVLSSLIENSPNSLCEAQTVGLPCVATYTGGIPSLISEGETGFMVPVGDAPMIAERVGRVFDNDKIAVEMSRRARAVALERHDPDAVVKKLLSVYRDVVGLYKKS